MEKIKTHEEIYDKIKGVVITGKYIDENENEVDFDFKDWFISELHEYGKQRHNEAIKAATKKIIEFYGSKGLTNTGNRIREKILKLLEP